MMSFTSLNCFSVAEASAGSDASRCLPPLSAHRYSVVSHANAGRADEQPTTPFPAGENSGPEYPNVARGLNSLAGLLSDTNRLAEAEPLFRRALAIDEKSFGPEHPDVARDLNNLALLLLYTDRLAEAEPLYRQVLRILAEFGHRTGHEHPHFRTAINNYAGLISEMGLSQEAIAARVRSAIEGEPA